MRLSRESCLTPSVSFHPIRVKVAEMMDGARVMKSDRTRVKKVEIW